MSETKSIDKFLNRWISRKLTVFAIASFFLFTRLLGEDNWTLLAIVYLIAQGTKDVIEVTKAFKRR